jgi:serine/threonine protein kinase
MDRCDCSLSTSGGTGQAFVSKLRISADLPRELAKQLLAGVSQLHSLHVIHRDLKPSNVLVRNSAAVLAVEGLSSSDSNDMQKCGSSSRRQPQLCLCDMGLSKRQSADYSISTLGDDVGTLGWRAPELRKAGAQATEASDVYTTGLIIYYILTGGCHVFDDDEDERVGAGQASANERQQAQLTYARQEAIDEIGREWERVQKYGSRASTTNVFALSASHRDLLSAEKDAEREQLMEGIVERLGIHRVHAQSSDSPGVAQKVPLRGLRLSSGDDENDGSVAEISTEAVSLLSRLLHPDPKKRPTAGEALADSFFQVVLEGQDQIEESELTIGGVIGDGAMGIVYRAKWRETDVAVKRLKRNDGNSHSQHSNVVKETQLKGDFVREVALLKRLRHPHVVLFMGWFLSSSSYLAADAEHESLCFVTELCWTSLYHLLHTTGGSSSGGGATRSAQHLHWARRLAMCLDAAKGMCFLHGEGIIHRDLKVTGYQLPTKAQWSLQRVLLLAFRPTLRSMCVFACDSRQIFSLTDPIE